MLVAQLTTVNKLFCINSRDFHILWLRTVAGILYQIVSTKKQVLSWDE